MSLDSGAADASATPPTQPAPLSGAPGRSCPLHYRYGAEALAVPAQDTCDALYVVGGLYGNPVALDGVLALFDREPAARKRLVFNGDFHWFDTDPATFTDIDERVLRHDALRGNVETELADDPAEGADDAGCGCAYPNWVGDAVVAHSNRMLQRLRRTAAGFPERRMRLGALPMWRRIDVGGQRVAIVHGDAESLAGWGFAQEHLANANHRQQVQGWFERARVDVFACSHTCLPVALSMPRGDGSGARVAVLNNGAAGMPNFRGDPAGLLTRIATQPFEGPERRHGLRQGGVFMDALAIDIDPARWQACFAAQWPPGSDAQCSYGERIAHGPAYSPTQARRWLD